LGDVPKVDEGILAIAEVFQNFEDIFRCSSSGSSTCLNVYMLRFFFYGENTYEWLFFAASTTKAARLIYAYSRIATRTLHTAVSFRAQVVVMYSDSTKN